jgi:hypothetical protein
MRLAPRGAARVRQARRKLFWRTYRSHRLFQRRIRHTAAMDRRASLRRSCRTVSIPSWSRQQSGRIFHWLDARRLSRRSCSLDGLHAAVRRTARSVCIWCRRPTGIDRCRPSARAQARGRRNRRASRLGYGAHTLPRPRTRINRRHRNDDYPAQFVLRRSDRGDRLGRHCGFVVVPRRSAG